MRRRLDLAATLVAKPPVLFLDEPTTGLDPRARLELWGVLDTLVDRGATLLLTTQYLEEAERLAHDIAVIDHGRVIAQGTSLELKRLVGGATLEIVARDRSHLAQVADIVTRVTGTQAEVDPSLRTVHAPTEGGPDIVVRAAAALRESHIPIDDLGLRQPTLDEVFLTLTGTQPHTAAADQPDLEEMPA
jgi:ABC-2 type transport system ATP-binding protein